MPTSLLMLWRASMIALVWWSLIPTEIAFDAVESELEKRGVPL